MATVPTGRLERELRKLYLRWVAGLPRHMGNEAELHAYIELFREQSLALTKKLGGDISRLGVAADFPAPRELELDLIAGKVYNQMHVEAIRASLASGINSRTAARAMLRAGMDSTFWKLERIARTETVRAYWKNQWNEADGLGLVMLWGAERGPRTCQWCLSRDGMVVEDREIRDHPNGRCTLVPTLASEVRYRGTVTSDGNITYDPTWRARHQAPIPMLTAMGGQ